MESTAVSIPVTLRWSKKTFQLTLSPTESATEFKEQVQSLTGVPTHRQKLLSKKGGWKGPLRDDFDFSSLFNKGAPSLTVSLIGSAETLQEPHEKTLFAEDLTPEQIKAAELAELQAAMKTATGMIPAIQFPPHQRDDNKTELHKLNHMVTGLPQRQIESLLTKQQEQQQDSDHKHEDEEPKATNFLGELAMTMGLELRRAYVNDMAVLVDDGTLVSVLDDGHVQLWKHGIQQFDVIHQGFMDGGVDSVIGLSSSSGNKNSSFVTAGRGMIRFWNDEAEEVLAFRASLVPGATAPMDLVQLELGKDGTGIAARFQITHQHNPHQFRIAPQNESERQRRAVAEAQEQALQETLRRASRTIQIWYSIGGRSEQQLQSRLLQGEEGTGALTCLATLPVEEEEGVSFLIAGDSAGYLQTWRIQATGIELDVRRNSLIHLVPSNGQGCSITCIEPLKDGRIAVSTQPLSTISSPSLAVTELEIQESQAVHILKVQSLSSPPRFDVTLNGHQDVVTSICELPNGDLLTAGGKLDATCRLWSQSQIGRSDEVAACESSRTLPDMGYILGLQVLRDIKPGSSHFAVAAARYNVVKVFL